MSMKAAAIRLFFIPFLLSYDGNKESENCTVLKGSTLVHINSLKLKVFWTRDKVKRLSVSKTVQKRMACLAD
jgi:hypothetical protein